MGPVVGAFEISNFKIRFVPAVKSIQILYTVKRAQIWTASGPVNIAKHTLKLCGSFHVRNLLPKAVGTIDTQWLDDEGIGRRQKVSQRTAMRLQKTRGQWTDIFNSVQRKVIERTVQKNECQRQVHKLDMEARMWTPSLRMRTQEDGPKSKTKLAYTTRSRT